MKSKSEEAIWLISFLILLVILINLMNSPIHDKHHRILIVLTEMPLILMIIGKFFI